MGRILLVALVAFLSMGLPVSLPAAEAAAAGTAAAPVTLTLGASGGGSIAATPPGASHEAGTVITLTATPDPGRTFIGWTINGANGGWANPRKLVLEANTQVVALFAPTVAFTDLPSNAAEAEAIRQISARGIIKGFAADFCAANGLTAPCFGPGFTIQRAEIAVMIVRALKWEGLNPAMAPFPDIADIDPELQRAISILFAQGVMQGYSNGNAGPADPVTRIQIISLITRAMVKAGYWTAATVNVPSLYPNIPASSPHRLDLVTFVQYAGPIPDRPQGQNWADWNTPAPRAWVARLIWQALDEYFTGGPFNPNPNNAPPVATGEGYTATEDTPFTQAAPGVLANDTDPDTDPLTAVLVAGPSHALSFALNANGSFSYTPAANYNGADSFTYRARDAGALTSAVTTVNLTVNAVNDAPVNGVPTTQNMLANTPRVFSTLNGNAITVADVDAGANPLRVTLTATQGTLTLGQLTGLSFTAGDGATDTTMTFTGTLTDINAALNGLSYAPNLNFVGVGTVQIVSEDQGSSGAGGALTDDDTVNMNIGVGPAANIVLDSNTGSLVVGEQRTLQVKVTDSTGVPVAGFAVAWSTANGSVSAPSTNTNASGIATVTWTLGTTAGPQSATATATGLTGSPVTFPATTVAGPALATTSTISTNQASITANGTDTATITVQLKDQYGNNLTASGGTVTLSTTGGTLGAVTDVGDGTYTATLTAPTVVGSATITGTLGVNPITDDATVAFVAGAAAKYLVTTTPAAPATVTAGSTVAVTAQLADANNNPVATAGLTVNWGSTNGGSFTPANTSTTNASGVATITFTTATTAGTAHTVSATDSVTPAITGTSGTITTQAGNAAKLAFVQQPTNAVAGVAIAPAVTVEIRDSNDNVVAGATDLVSLAITTGTGSVGATLGGTTAVAAVNGVATFSDLDITLVGTGYTLTATAGALTAATSTAFAITPGSASPVTSTITASPTSIAADGAATSTITVQLKDPYGNNLTTSGGTVTLSLVQVTGANLGSLGAVTNNGDGTYTATLTAPTTVGSVTVEGQLGGNDLVDDAAVAYVAGAATKYLVSVSSSSPPAGTGITVTAQLADANNNPVATAGLTVNWSSTNGGSFTPAATSTTNASGVATITFTVATLAGTQHVVTATDSVTPAITGNSATIIVQPGAAAQLAFVVQPSSAVAGAAITPAVQVAIRDSFGNTVTTATSSVTVVITPGSGATGAVLSGTATVNAVAGVATFSTLSIDLVDTDYTLTATSGVLTSATSNQFAITPGAVASFAFATIGEQGAGTPFTVTVTARDQFGNTATGFTGTVNFTSTPAGGITAGAGPSANFVAGVLSSHSITIGSGGNFTLTATRTGGAETGTSNSFLVDTAPTVTTTVPANAATQVATNTNIAITFSEAVTASGSWFTISCATSGAHTAAVTGGPTSYTLNPDTDFTAGEVCTVTVVAAQVADQDGTPTTMATNHVFSFTTDVGPTVTTTTPANNATGVAQGATITVNFSESVNATTSSFTIDCSGTGVSYSLSASPATSFTLTPTPSLPAGTLCTVTVVAAQVTDADSGDPPDTMAANHVFSFAVPPVAVNDTYSPTVIGNVGVNTSTSGFSILTNDTPSTGVTINSSGTTVQGGTVVIAANGTFTYTPAAGYEGTDSFTYTITAPGGTSAAATVTISSVADVIWFIDANAATNGDGRLGTPFNCLTGTGCFNAVAGDDANDIIFLYESATDYAGPITLLLGQRLIGQDSTATLAARAGLTPSADSLPLPTMNAANGVIARIVNTATTAGFDNDVILMSNNHLYGLTLGNATEVALSGTSFGTLTVADVTIGTTGQALSLTTGTLSGSFVGITSSGGNNNVFLSAVAASGTVALGTGGLSGASGAALAITGASSGSFTYGGTIAGGTAGAAINIAAGTASLAVSGNVSQGNNSALVSVSGGHATGTLTLTGQVSASNGTGLQFDNADGTYNLGGVLAGSTLNGGNAGVDILNGSDGVFTFGANLSITNPSGTAFYVGGSAATVTMNGPISQNAGKRGVHLENNGGVIATFTGTLTLNTTTETAFEATNSTLAGTVVVQTATANVLATTTATALRVNNVNIGAGGLTFRSISANGGANGIVLNNTGASAGLTVTGNSAGICGGSVSAGVPATATAPVTSDCTGGTIQNTSGSAIVLTNTGSVSLTRVWITGADDDGIKGTTVNGFALVSSLIENSGNANGEANIDFGDVGSTTPSGLVGTGSITNSTLQGAYQKNVSVRNFSGTLSSFTVTGSQFRNSAGNGEADDNLALEASGTASMLGISITGSYFAVTEGDHFQASGVNSGTLGLVFRGNTLVGGHSTPLGQGITISAATGVAFGGYTGTITYDIDGNSINGAASNGIIVNLGTSGAGGTFNGRIRNNIIGTTGVSLSCSSQANGIAIDAHGNGTHTVAVTNNTLRQCFDRGIFVLANDGNGVLNLTVTGNSVSDMSTDVNGGREAFNLVAGATNSNVFSLVDSHAVCLQLGGAGALANTLVGGPQKTGDIRLRQRFQTSIRLPGYAGTPFDTIAVIAYLQAPGNNNGATATATAQDDAGATTDGFYGGASCAQPSFAGDSVVAMTGVPGRGGFLPAAGCLGWWREEETHAA